MHPPCAAGRRSWASAAQPDAPVRRRNHHWYRGPIVRGTGRVFLSFPRRSRGVPCPPPTIFALGVTVVSGLLASGCGGGSRQDAHEKSASFQIKVLSASFPAKQAVARPAQMSLKIKNTGSHAIPNVSITVDSFNYSSNYPGLAANKRPIWAIERGPGAIAKPPVESEEVSNPGGGQTAYVNTWALGPLRAGKTQTFTWQVIPVKAGAHTVRYTVNAGFGGKALARLAAGGPAAGHFAVDIAGEPPITHVDPATGKVVPGT